MMFAWLKSKVCQHAFALEDLEMTGIPALEKPPTNDYQEWADYYRDIYNHDSHTKRVVWPCALRVGHIAQTWAAILPGAPPRK